MKSRYLRDIRNSFREELIPLYPPLEINSIFQMLIAHQFGFDRTILAMEPHLELKASQAEALLDALDQLKNHRPVQYIIGTALFMGMPLAVNSAVLIPRPETEELVTWLGESFARDESAPVILDAGTGSGCIAISLALEYPDTHVDAWDLSRDALETATSNQRRLGSKVNFIRKDALSPDSWKGSQDYHLIVSNPPYIADNESSLMPVDVKDWEPASALFAPDQGLAFYRTMADCAPALLQRSGGCIMMEIGFQQGPAVEEIFKRKLWNNVTTFKDLAGHERLVVGHRSLKS